MEAQKQAAPSASVLGLTLESYLDLAQALTKGGSRVQRVPVLEAAYYKTADLKQVLAARTRPLRAGPGGPARSRGHGCAASLRQPALSLPQICQLNSLAILKGSSRKELFVKLEGQAIINPIVTADAAAGASDAQVRRTRTGRQRCLVRAVGAELLDDHWC